MKHSHNKKNMNSVFLCAVVCGALSINMVPTNAQRNPDISSSVFNTTTAWGAFFSAYPELWKQITTALNQVRVPGHRLIDLLIGPLINWLIDWLIGPFAIDPHFLLIPLTLFLQGSTADLNLYSNQIQTLFQTKGFADPDVQINDATPGLHVYQSEVRRALLDIGLPGTAGVASSSGVDSATTSYAIQSPFPIFVNQTGSVVGPTDGDTAWFLGCVQTFLIFQSQIYCLTFVKNFFTL